LPSLIIQNVRVSNKQIEADAVTSDKIRDAEVKTADLADSAITTAKIADSQVTTAKLADSVITATKLTNEILQFGNAAIDSVSTYITFPVAFPGTPQVMAVGIDVNDVRITDVTPGSFAWVAEAAGSARWVASYRS